MAKMRYNSAIGQIEIEGSSDEIVSIITKLNQLEKASKNKETPTIVYEGKRYKRWQSHDITFPRMLLQETNDQKELEAKMPTIEQIIEYILSKPRYEHDIIDIAKKFFNKQIQSREYGRLYRKLSSALEIARKRIESERHGAFERKSSRPRNLQVYSFRQVNATPLGTTLQKTS